MTSYLEGETVDIKLDTSGSRNICVVFTDENGDIYDFSIDKCQAKYLRTALKLGYKFKKKLVDAD